MNLQCFSERADSTSIQLSRRTNHLPTFRRPGFIRLRIVRQGLDLRRMLPCTTPFDMPSGPSLLILPIEWVDQHAFEPDRVRKAGPRKAAIYCRQSVLDLRPVSIDRQDYRLRRIQLPRSVCNSILASTLHRSEPLGLHNGCRKGLKDGRGGAERGEIDVLVVRRWIASDAMSVTCARSTSSCVAGRRTSRRDTRPISFNELVLLGSMAQQERSRMIERSVQGTRIAAARGRLIGRYKQYGNDRTRDDETSRSTRARRPSFDARLNLPSVAHHLSA